MVDGAVLPPELGPSVIEKALLGWLDGQSRGSGFLLDFPPHGPGAVRAARDADAVAGDAVAVAGGSVEPQARVLAGLLEAGAAHLDRARAAHLAQCRQAAVQARELAAFAACRPAAVLDRPDAEVGAAAATSRAGRPAGLTAVSEWAVDEVMVALGLTAPAARRLLDDAVTLVHRLPGTLEALAAGTVSWAAARMLAEVLAPLADERLRAELEGRLLARAGGRTVSQLRVAARRAVLRADAAAAVHRLAAAVRERAVRVYPGADGMATLAATLPLPVALACRKVLAAYAGACAVPGDARSTDQRMVDCLADLLLRPDGAGRPPVQAQLTIVAGVPTLTGAQRHGHEPGEVEGQPVPAVLIRELAHTLGLLPRPEQAQPAGTPAAADPHEAAAARLADLLTLPTTAGTALVAPPTIAVVDELSGQLLALASPTELRRAAACLRPACRTGRTPCSHPPAGNGLTPPPAAPGYRPSTALQRFVRARDRRCRFPGCRARADRCDLDHNTPWPAGATSCDNLCCLCRHHHRLSHQAPGWTMHRLPDGGLTWTTPGGHRLTTHPPRYGTDDNLPPPTPAAVEQPRPQPLTQRERVLGRPATPEERRNDPPPF